MTFFFRYFYISYKYVPSFFSYILCTCVCVCVCLCGDCLYVSLSVCKCLYVCVVVPVYPSYPVIVCCSSDQPSNVCNILFGYFVFFHFSFTVIVVTLTAAAIPMLYTPNISKKRTKPLLIFTKCF